MSRPDRNRQLAQAEDLAGLYRPVTDAHAQAAMLAEVIRPAIAAHLSELRVPRPTPDRKLMAACRELGRAVDGLDNAKLGSRLDASGALRRLERASRAVKRIIDGGDRG